MRRAVLILMLLVLAQGCGLSERQQIGVLRFVAGTITGAVDPAPAPKPAKQADRTPCPGRTARS